MRALIVLAIVGAGLIAAVRNRFAGLTLYTWFALFRPQEFAWRTIDSLHLSAVVVMTLIVPAVANGTLFNISHPLHLGTLAFLGTALVALPGAQDQTLAWFYLKDLIPLVVVSVIATRFLNTRSRITVFLMVAGVSLGVHGAYTGLRLAAVGGGQITTGPGGPFNDNNAYALGLVRVVFFLLIAAGSVKPKWLRAGLYGMVPLCLVTIVFSYSRGAFLALAASAFAYVLLQRRPIRKLVAGAVISGVLMLLVPESYTARLATIGTYDGDASATGRLHFWRVAVAMVADRPLGVGLGNFEVMYDAYDDSNGRYGQARASHSSHLQALSETGLLGFLVFEGLQVSALLALWRVRRLALSGVFHDPEKDRFFLRVANGLGASTIAFLVGGTFLSQALNDLNFLTFAVVAALDLAAREVAEDAAPAPAVIASVGPGTRARHPFAVPGAVPRHRWPIVPERRVPH